MAELPDEVATAVDRHVNDLLDGAPARAADLPHRATWDPASRTLEVEYPDGVRARVVLQVNSSLPPGHPAVLRPAMDFVDGAWRQSEPAGVVLPAHAPPDAAARADLVRQELDNAWRTLHQQFDGVRPGEPLPEPVHGPGLAPAGRDSDVSLAALEEGDPDVPVLDADALTFRDATPSQPVPPRPLTPEAVRSMLADRTLPDQLAGWVREHLATRADDGSFVPRPADEIAATVRRLEQEAAQAVAAPARPITAAAVPDSQLHGYGRDVADPAAVLRTGRDELDAILHLAADDAPVRGVRLDLTTVEADSLPQRAVARSVPVDAQGRDLPPGTVPPDGGGYRIELSDRAADLAITRAVAHEVAELSAILQRAADGLDLSVPDVLRPGDVADGARLSPHDAGRLAEVDVLARLLGDPEHAAYARSELAALRDHLGLRPDEPGSAARRDLADPHLTPGGRAALDDVGFKLSDEANERIFRDGIVPDRLAGATTQQHPVVVFVGGQTGAGKTAITDMIKLALEQRGRYINVNMDFYNPYHPAFDRLQAADETTASAHVRPDGEVWWDKAQGYAIEHRNDVVLETAMRTAAEFEDIAARFRAAGYRVETAIVAVPEASSRLGVLDRFWREVEAAGHGRYVERASHDATYAGVMRAASALDAGRFSDSVFVFRRGGEMLYSNHLDADGQWVRPPATAEAVHAERTRVWTTAEDRWFTTAVERLREAIDPRWRPEVDEIAELGRSLSPSARAADDGPRALPAAPDAGTPARPPGPEPAAGPEPGAAVEPDAGPEPRAAPEPGARPEPGAAVEPGVAPARPVDVADALRGEPPAPPTAAPPARDTDAAEVHDAAPDPADVPQARWPGYPALAENPLSWSDRMHIVYGDELDDYSGGHLSGTGRPGKTEFPPAWDEERIAHEVVETVRNPHTAEEQFDGTWLVTAVRDGVVVGVYLRPDGTIATGFPIEGPGVTRNPRGE
ncbi:MAG TPA: zeta toxin family protein [Pilimelia sp.]|nr:zeta toxin family protein [Pilimelia sp.]